MENDPVILFGFDPNICETAQGQRHNEQQTQVKHHMKLAETPLRTRPVLLGAFLALLLSACGGGGSTESDGNIIATLYWQPPTQNTDETPLEDLSGYTLYVGDSRTTLKRVDIPIPADATSLHIDSNDLLSANITIENGNGPVTVYFALTAYNSLHIESQLSEVVSKTF